ncbi:hypothetical protein C1X61_07325 [Pseudomonas sp. FW215-T2]|nr:hypothetical protein C1X61_07325 [Pseudomonas sp. FW215-T2]PNA11616.1 hypothetical protein C1X62_14795 [Pseudomonas sp. FW215-R3]PNB37188.1 hypothetical protein C1X63_14010 [Pseudomonas sp. FW305-131]
MHAQPATTGTDRRSRLFCAVLRLIRFLKPKESPAGASLLAMRSAQSTSLLTQSALSRAGSRLQVEN